MAGALPTASLGLRLTFHPENRARVVALFVWAFLAVLTATMVTTLPAAMNRAGRVDLLRAPVNPPASAVSPVTRPVYFNQRQSLYRGSPVNLVDLIGQPDVPPPGVAEAPGPGEVVVSPALGRVLDDAAQRDELRQRVPGVVIGRISDEGLAYPDELIAYVGLAPTAGSPPPGDPLAGWGLASSSAAEERLPRPAAIAFGLVIGIPLVGLFVAGMTFGSRRREQALARLNLLGAPRSLQAVLLLAETVLAVVVGIVAGMVATPAVAGGISSRFPRSVRPFAGDLSALTAASRLRVVGFVLCVVVVGCYVAARSFGQPARSTPKIGRSGVVRWGWPVLFLLSLLGSTYLSTRSDVPGSAIVIAAFAVATTAALSLRPLTGVLAGCLHRVSGALAVDLAVARLRYGGSATLRGAQGVVCVLIALGIGIGVVQVLDAALTVSEVIWKPSLVQDDTVFVSTTAAGVQELERTGSSEMIVPALLTYADLGSGANRRTLVVACDGAERLVPESGQDCPRLVVKPGDASFATPSQLRFGAVAVDVGPADHSDMAAPSEFFGDLDAAVLVVDTRVWHDIQAQVSVTPFRDLAIVQIPTSSPGSLEKAREALWNEPALSFSGGRSSLATVVAKQDFLNDADYYVQIYGTLIELTSWLLLAVFAVGAVFGAIADVLDGRDQADRLDILGATGATRRVAQCLRSSLPFVVGVAVGSIAGMTLGIAYSRLSRYTDVLSGPLAGFPVVPALAGALAALGLLVTLVVGVVLWSDRSGPLDRLRDR